MKLQFGTCLLDTERRQLFRSREEVRLSPKAFDLLTVLIEMRPRALSKAELHQKVWPDVFVSDASLTKLVKEIRTATADDAREGRYVRTVYGFGYAFNDAAELLPEAHPVSAEGKCWLVWEGRETRLREGDNLIGRDPDARVVLDFPRVSRSHARILIRGREAQLEDLGSKNGTRLRGLRLREPARLAHGDEIRIGPVSLSFRVVLPQGPTESEVSETGSD